MTSDVPAGPESPIRSVFLLADSQLLFHQENGERFLGRVRDELGPRVGPRAAYLGAANGDVPEYYDIFLAAMEGIGIRACRHVRADASVEDRAFLAEADVIVLAGGDPARGAKVLHESGLDDPILTRYAAGAVLIGVSAGAVQLGQQIAPGVDGLRLAPVAVGAHDEPEWTALADLVTRSEGLLRGLGIPAGAGAVVHPDLSVEPVRKALTEIALVEGEIRRALLLPPGRGGEDRGGV